MRILTPQKLHRHLVAKTVPKMGKLVALAGPLQYNSQPWCYNNKTTKKPNVSCAIPCRWLTLLIYLNEVEDGGETAFPGANKPVFDITVRLETKIRQRE